MLGDVVHVEGGELRTAQRTDKPDEKQGPISRPGQGSFRRPGRVRPAALIGASVDDELTASSNRSKSDLDPAQWKPSREAAWCQYARDWVTIKKAWDLTAERDEVDDLRVMLRTCA